MGVEGRALMQTGLHLQDPTAIAAAAAAAAAHHDLLRLGSLDAFLMFKQSRL